jgi:hypothetical protein
MEVEIKRFGSAWGPEGTSKDKKLLYKGKILET